MRELEKGGEPTVPAADGGRNSQAKGDRRLGMSVIKEGFGVCAQWVCSVVRAMRLRKPV